MRRFLGALAALILCAAPAGAKTLIVRYQTTLVNSEDGEQQFSDLTGLMQRRGGSYAVIPLQASKTEWLRTGLHVWKGWNLASVDAEQFDAVVILGFHIGQLSPSGAARAESLTFTSKWPTVPVVFFGNTAANGSKWTAQAACSTGVKSLGTGYSSVRRTYSLSPVGSTLPWKSMSVNFHPVVPIAPPTGVTVRSVVKMGYTSVTSGGIPTASSMLRTDADSGYATAGSDSVVLWTTNMISAANGGPAAATAPKPIIFCDAGAGVAQDVGLMAMAMQMADSAAGGRIWDKAGASPIKLGFAVTQATSRGKYTNDLSGNSVSIFGGGTFCYADSCDTTNVLAGLDSLGTLPGLKTTFYVDPCSLSTYPSVKGWFSRAGSYRVGIQPISGAIAGQTSAATSSFPADPFGRLRTRFAAQSSGCTAASDTALITCEINWQKALVQSYFPGLVDASAYPAFGDWSPVAYTKLGGGPGSDSVAYAIWKAGIRSIVIWPQAINSNPSATAGASTAGGVLAASAGPTDPYGYFPDTRYIDIFSTIDNSGVGVARSIGRLKLIAERGMRSGPNVAYTDPSHDIKTEWFEGAVTDRWYNQPIRYYYHSFWTHTPLLTVSLGQLGGHGVSPGAIGVGPARIGWWTIKHVANEVAAANALGWVAPNGSRRAMFTWSYVSDLEP